MTGEEGGVGVVKLWMKIFTRKKERRAVMQMKNDEATIQAIGHKRLRGGYLDVPSVMAHQKVFDAIGRTE